MKCKAVRLLTGLILFTIKATNPHDLTIFNVKVLRTKLLTVIANTCSLCSNDSFPFHFHFIAQSASLALSTVKMDVVTTTTDDGEHSGPYSSGESV